MKSPAGRIATLIHRFSHGRFGHSAASDNRQAYRTYLHGQGLPLELTITLEGVLDEVAATLTNITVQDRAKILTTLCDGLVALTRTGQGSLELLRSYAVTKAQELLRDKGYS